MKRGRSVIALIFLCVGMLFAMPLSGHAAQTPTALQSYIEWPWEYVDLTAHPELLNQCTHMDDAGEGRVHEGFVYPDRWPGALLEGRVPEYTGTGWLYELCLTHPGMSLRWQDISMVSVGIAEYEAGDLKEYGQALAESGLEPYTDATVLEEIRLQMAWPEDVQIFLNEECQVFMLSGKRDAQELQMFSAYEMETGDLGRFNDAQAAQADERPYVQIEMHFLTDAYAPGTQVAKPSLLSNAANWEDAPDVQMDALEDDYLDPYGRRYETIAYPSRWYREVFGDLAPEYTYPGLMKSLLITTPAAADSYAETLIATLSITDFQEEGIEAYAAQLQDFGYVERRGDALTQQEKELIAQQEMKRYFYMPGQTVVLTILEENGEREFSIILRMEGRYASFFGFM